MYNQEYLIKFIKVALFFASFFLIFGVINDKSYSAIRQKISLNGTWDFKWGNDRQLKFPLSKDGWTKTKVPEHSPTATGFGKKGTKHWAWYKRKVRILDSMKGEKIKLLFKDVKYKTYIYWNGEQLGEYLIGEIPFEIDVTGKAEFGEDNELLVGVIDRISIQRQDILPYLLSDFGTKRMLI